MKVLAIGDIHTKLWIINKVAEVIDEYDKVVFVGDYADDWGKGPISTIETWKSLMLLQSVYSEKVATVIGNHDYAYLLSFDPRSGGYNNITQTLLNSPENRKLKEWLSGLSITTEIDGITYSHAGITQNWDKDTGEYGLWSDESPLWARPQSRVLSSIQYEPNQVFGHTPSETCWEVQHNVWCIDTFSTYRDGTPFGDQTVLEIIDGKEFKKIKL